jgi:hypothetical protein
MPDSINFLAAFRGSFTGILRWPKLDELWETVLQQDSQNWYIYAVGETPPEDTASREQLEQFITSINELLHKEHAEDYCGVVYADDLQHPAFIKIFDPNNLGVSCGFSNSPPLPGWILSAIKPTDLPAAIPQPGNRKRWWQKLFG